LSYICDMKIINRKSNSGSTNKRIIIVPNSPNIKSRGAYELLKNYLIQIR